MFYILIIIIMLLNGNEEEVQNEKLKFQKIMKKEIQD